jgi:hypothetical protein
MENPQKYYEPFEGFLLKRGENSFFKAWKRRWFSLQNNVLTYRESALDLTIRGKISLADASVFRTDPQQFGQGGYFQVTPLFSIESTKNSSVEYHKSNIFSLCRFR